MISDKEIMKELELVSILLRKHEVKVRIRNDLIVCLISFLALLFTGYFAFISSSGLILKVLHGLLFGMNLHTLLTSAIRIKMSLKKIRRISQEEFLQKL